MRKLIVLASTILLCSCATYHLTLMPRDGGQVASGTASQADKTITITLAGKVYRGTYSYVQDGSFGFGNAFGTAVGPRVVATGSAWGNSFAMSAMGGGMALLRANDGTGLRCRFSYSSMTAQGTGECMDDQHKLYDMQINTGY